MYDQYTISEMNGSTAPVYGREWSAQVRTQTGWVAEQASAASSEVP